MLKNPERVIYEGWTVEDFVNALSNEFNLIEKRGFNIRLGDMNTRKQVEDWCKSRQPFYKKRIPEVTSYFWERMRKALRRSF